MNLLPREPMADRDRDHVTIEIELMLANAQPVFTKECCIYRVPHEIRKFKQDAYTPTYVSIGPFHYGNSNLVKMEGYKRQHGRKFIERFGSDKEKLGDLLSCLREEEPKVRGCYADDINLSKKELVEVIFVDCVFVIEIFLRHYYGEGGGDGVTVTPWSRDNIALDLLLLENQLPFFILEKLYKLAFKSSLENGDHPPFLNLALAYFEGYISENLPPTCTGKHFTDLLRTSHLQSSNKELRTVCDDLVLRYTATDLNEAGVKFRVNDGSKSFLDLQFSRSCRKSCLKIPRTQVTNPIEVGLRNMVALEQCHYPEETYIANYLQVMNFLINTDKDVEVLVKNSIIDHFLGDSNEVAEWFNGLGKNILHNNLNEDYHRIIKELNAYCKHPLRCKMASLKRDYCNTPWMMLASVAGIAMLVLTLTQTVFSIIK